MGAVRIGSLAGLVALGGCCLSVESGINLRKSGSATGSGTTGTHTTSGGTSSGAGASSGGGTSTGRTGTTSAGQCSDFAFSAASVYPTDPGPSFVALGRLIKDKPVDLVVGRAGGAGSFDLLFGSQGGFGGPVQVNAGTDPQFAAVADLNRDGNLDLIVPNVGGDSVAVYLGDGKGSFQPSASFSISWAYWAVVLNLSGDQYLDLAFASGAIGNGAIAVLQGHGDGTFSQPVLYPVGSNPIFIASADFNSDGFPDLVTANTDMVTNQGTASVLLSNGDAGFQSSVSYPGGLHVSGVATGDFNGDGNQDFIVSNIGSSSLDLYLGQGDGSFVGSMLPVSSGQIGITAADINGDGVLDLIWTSTLTGTSIVIQLGNGDGTFQSEMSYPVGVLNLGGATVTIGDVNGDGKPDIVVPCSGSNSVDVLLNQSLCPF